MTDREPRALRLAKLPDRNPMKMTITLSAKLHSKLRAYAQAYREVYGETEDPAVLITYIVETFIDADRKAARSRPRGPVDQSA